MEEGLVLSVICFGASCKAKEDKGPTSPIVGPVQPLLPSFINSSSTLAHTADTLRKAAPNMATEASPLQLASMAESNEASIMASLTRLQEMHVAVCVYSALELYCSDY